MSLSIFLNEELDKIWLNGLKAHLTTPHNFVLYLQTINLGAVPYFQKSFINERKVEFSVGRSLSQECTFLFDSERGLDVRSQFIIFHLQKYGGTVTSLYKRFSVSCNQKVGKHLAQKKSSAWNMDFTQFLFL